MDVYSNYQYYAMSSLSFVLFTLLNASFGSLKKNCLKKHFRISKQVSQSNLSREPHNITSFEMSFDVAMLIVKNK